MTLFSRETTAVSLETPRLFFFSYAIFNLKKKVRRHDIFIWPEHLSHSFIFNPIDEEIYRHADCWPNRTRIKERDKIRGVAYRKNREQTLVIPLSVTRNYKNSFDVFRQIIEHDSLRVMQMKVVVCVLPDDAGLKRFLEEVDLRWHSYELTFLASTLIQTRVIFASEVANVTKQTSYSRRTYWLQYNLEYFGLVKGIGDDVKEFRKSQTARGFVDITSDYWTWQKIQSKLGTINSSCSINGRTRIWMGYDEIRDFTRKLENIQADIKEFEFRISRPDEEYIGIDGNSVFSRLEQRREIFSINDFSWARWPYQVARIRAVCLALPQRFRLVYVVLRIMNNLPCMNFWTDYKKVECIEAICKSIKKIETARQE